MGTGIIGTVMTLGAVGGLRQAINTYTPLELSEEAFRANAEMYMQKMGHVDPLNLTVRDQEAYQKIINTVCQDAMDVVMMVLLGLMAAGAVLAFTLKQKCGLPPRQGKQSLKTRRCMTYSAFFGILLTNTG